MGLVILLILGVGVIVVIATNLSTPPAEAASSGETSVQQLRDNLALDDLAFGSGRLIGVSSQRKAIALIQRSGEGIWIPFDRIASVELVREYGETSSSFGETKTSRGSQLVGAALGGAIAGPAGLVVGGLSGKTTTRSFGSSTQHLDAVHLKMRLYSDQIPFVSLSSGYAEGKFERIAARIQNAIDCRSAGLGARALDEPFDPMETVDAAAVFDFEAPARGWWQRTFG